MGELVLLSSSGIEMGSPMQNRGSKCPLPVTKHLRIFLSCHLLPTSTQIVRTYTSKEGMLEEIYTQFSAFISWVFPYILFTCPKFHKYTNKTQNVFNLPTFPYSNRAFHQSKMSSTLLVSFVLFQCPSLMVFSDTSLTYVVLHRAFLAWFLLGCLIWSPAVAVALGSLLEKQSSKPYPHPYGIGICVLTRSPQSLSTHQSFRGTMKSAFLCFPSLPLFSLYVRKHACSSEPDLHMHFLKESFPK